MLWFKKKSEVIAPSEVITVHENVSGNYFYHIAVDDVPLCGRSSTMRRELRLESWGMVSHIGERYCKECERLAVERRIL